VIHNDVRAFGNKCHFNEVVTNTKMFGSDKFCFCSASEDGKIVIFAPQVSTHACVKFLSRSLRVLQKMEIKLVG